MIFLTPGSLPFTHPSLVYFATFTGYAAWLNCSLSSTRLHCSAVILSSSLSEFIIAVWKFPVNRITTPLISLNKNHKIRREFREYQTQFLHLMKEYSLAGIKWLSKSHNLLGPEIEFEFSISWLSSHSTRAPEYSSIKAYTRFYELAVTLKLTCQEWRRDVLLPIQSNPYHQNFGLFSFQLIWSNHGLKINENCHPYLV